MPYRKSSTAFKFVALSYCSDLFERSYRLWLVSVVSKRMI